MDKEVKSKFEALIEAAGAGRLDHWKVRKEDLLLLFCAISILESASEVRLRHMILIRLQEN